MQSAKQPTTFDFAARLTTMQQILINMQQTFPSTTLAVLQEWVDDGIKVTHPTMEFIMYFAGLFDTAMKCIISAGIPNESCQVVRLRDLPQTACDGIRQILYELSNIHSQIGSHDIAIDYADTAARMAFIALPYIGERILLLYYLNLAAIQQAAGRYADAITRYQSALFRIQQGWVSTKSSKAQDDNVLVSTYALLIAQCYVRLAEAEHADAKSQGFYLQNAESYANIATDKAPNLIDGLVIAGIATVRAEIASIQHTQLRVPEEISARPYGD
jgi:tetratricopeptide (TPR) repeat protein